MKNVLKRRVLNISNEIVPDWTPEKEMMVQKGCCCRIIRTITKPLFSVQVVMDDESCSPYKYEKNAQE